MKTDNPIAIDKYEPTKVWLVSHRFYLLFLFLCLLSCHTDDAPKEDKGVALNQQPTGASAFDLLSSEVYDRLQLEVAYNPGQRPLPKTIDNIITFLSMVTHKSETDITVTYQELPPSEATSLNVVSTVALEETYRTAYTKDNTIAVYIYFSDLPDSDDDPLTGRVTTGATYRNTSIIMFEETIRDLQKKEPSISLETIETATLQHEFGHLLGLVNLGTPMVEDHEHPFFEHHCIEENCLMRAELELGSESLKFLRRNHAKNGNTIPVLKPSCLQDLQAFGGPLIRSASPDNK
ncbi:MAG: hypothetical protein AAGF77_13760 [Bacteroidota bacterium]